MGRFPTHLPTPFTHTHPPGTTPLTSPPFPPDLAPPALPCRCTQGRTRPSPPASLWTWARTQPHRPTPTAARPPAPLGQPNFTAAQSHPHTSADHSRNGGRVGGEASNESHGPQMGNGGRASNESHGPQMGNGGRATTGARPTINPPIQGGPCLNCGATSACKWCGGGGRGSGLQGKICHRCWWAGFRVPGPPPAGRITSFFPSKKQKEE